MQSELLNLEKNRFQKSKVIFFNIIIRLFAILIPLLQVVPTTFDIYCKDCFLSSPKSMPLFLYLYRFNLSMIQEDFFYYIDRPGTIFIIFGFLFFFISFIYQVINRNQMIKKGPYKYLKHPQYLAICLITLGFTLKSFNTQLDFYPLGNLNYRISDNLVILVIWIVEVFFYVILAIIKDFSLKASLGEYYLDYLQYIKLNWKSFTKINYRFAKASSILIVLLTCLIIDFLMAIFNVFG
ncbi:MAG: hypothetical protein ACFFBP_20745 [Promethearchaeota archaeon]